MVVVDVAAVAVVFVVVRLPPSLVRNRLLGYCVQRPLHYV